MMESPTRRALRDRKLSDLGPRPSWWRVLARRRWQKRHDAIMAIDISFAAEMLSRHYSVEAVIAASRRRTIDYLCKPSPVHSWTVPVRRGELP